jgi:deazaflavin-dependent oxidoreductase (nitroreductase family)
MTVTSDFNQAIVDEFRGNAGEVGGGFTGAPMVLLHHTGRKSGTEFLTPLVYLQAEDDPSTIYVFASKGGAPEDPEWYTNLIAAGTTTVEVGSDTYSVAVSEVTGAKRDKVYSEQEKRMPGFAEYAAKTAGIRVIPVVALTRS